MLSRNRNKNAQTCRHTHVKIEYTHVYREDNRGKRVGKETDRHISIYVRGHYVNLGK